MQFAQKYLSHLYGEPDFRIILYMQPIYSGNTLMCMYDDKLIDMNILVNSFSD